MKKLATLLFITIVTCCSFSSHAAWELDTYVDQFSGKTKNVGVLKENGRGLAVLQCDEIHNSVHLVVDMGRDTHMGFGDYQIIDYRIGDAVSTVAAIHRSNVVSIHKLNDSSFLNGSSAALNDLIAKDNNTQLTIRAEDSAGTIVIKKLNLYGFTAAYKFILGVTSCNQI